MTKFKLLLLALLPSFAFAQQTVEFNNMGEVIYTQKGAVITIQGSLKNGTDSTMGVILNDGTIEVTGDFENSGNSVFTTYNDTSSKDRAVKFVGSGTQAIKGQMNNPATASFYNLVVDKAGTTDTVALHTSVTVNGSVVFGTGTTSSTFNPSGTYTTHNNKGLIRTYNGTQENVLTLNNGNTDAIAGYAPMAINGNPSTAYILTSGVRGSANGGLQRKITTAGSYDFPIGTNEYGFNGIRMNFTTIPSGGGMVTGKFNDGTDNANGYIGMVSQQCIGCTPDNPSPDNNGYNRYFSINPCNNNTPQWLVLQDAVKDHGYWSFAAASNERSYQYSVETFPNAFTMEGTPTDAWRTLKYTDTYGANPTGAAIDWSRDIDSVANLNDLVSYTLNTGDCYTGTGIPGGTYTGFGHFTTKMGKTGGALPVVLMYVNATPNGNAIDVTWATALEINNRGFEVERSIDGLNFTAIGWVAGHNNSTVQNNYTYTDNDVTANVLYYYRLNQVDNDGATEKSDVVSTMIKGTAPVATFAIGEPVPNPAISNTTIGISSSVNQDITVRLVNMVGQVLSVQTIAAIAGNSTLSFDVTNLPNGSYNAVLSTSDNSFSKIIVVSK